MLAGTRASALEALAAELGERAHVGLADLSDPAAPDRLVKEAETAMSRVDILVNNAGLTRDALTLRMTDADLQAVLDVNLTAAFRLTRLVLRGMLRRRHGRVIGVTSVVALTGNPGQANYAAAKAGMIGMSKSIAAEVAGRGITVNCVAPGAIVTAMTNKLTAEQQARLARATIPAGRFGMARGRRCRRPLSRRVPRRPMSLVKPCTSTAAWPWYKAPAPSRIGAAGEIVLWDPRVSMVAPVATP